MDCNEYFALSLFQSNNLINDYKYDITYIRCTITTWTEKKIGSADGWHFLMPNTTRDGKKGIAVALSHGVTIFWDAHKKFHCFTVQNNSLGNTVNGTCHQSKKK